MKILIMDDEYFILQDLLENVNWRGLGFEPPLLAYGAAQARPLFHENPDIDILLTDIEMPIESGFDFIEWVYAEKHNPVIILLTGHERFDYAKQAIELRVKYYLTKPLDPAELTQCLRNAIREAKKRKLYPDLFLPADTPDSSSPVESVISFIHQNISSPDLNRRMISEAVYLSEDYISFLFKKEMNRSLSSYIQDERVRAAMMLLSMSEESLQNISFKTGFSSLSYFHYQFKRKTGMTPQQYREKERPGTKETP